MKKRYELFQLMTVKENGISLWVVNDLFTGKQLFAGNKTECKKELKKFEI